MKWVKGFYLHALQLFDQRPAAYEAFVEQGQDGRTFQDSLPESSPRTYRGQMDISAVHVDISDVTGVCKCLAQVFSPQQDWSSNAPQSRMECTSLFSASARSKASENGR